jgi:hypothetical protein
MSEEPEELAVIARRWLNVIRECGDDVRELIHDGHPTACVGDAAFAYVDAFTAHVNVGFFHGADLPDPEGLLLGAGKHMRHVKLTPGGTLDDAALAGLIEAAYADIKRRMLQQPSAVSEAR